MQNLTTVVDIYFSTDGVELVQRVSINWMVRTCQSNLQQQSFNLSFMTRLETNGVIVRILLPIQINIPGWKWTTPKPTNNLLWVVSKMILHFIMCLFMTHSYMFASFLWNPLTFSLNPIFISWNIDECKK